MTPALVARDFKFLEVFPKETVQGGLLGKTKYYAIRVEFQVHGSPIYSLIYIDCIFPYINKRHNILDKLDKNILKIEKMT